MGGGGEWSASRLDSINPRKRALLIQYTRTGGRMGPRICVDAVERKRSLAPGKKFEPEVIGRPVRSLRCCRESTSYSDMQKLGFQSSNATRCDDTESGFPGIAIRRKLITIGTFHIAKTETLETVVRETLQCMQDMLQYALSRTAAQTVHMGLEAGRALSRTLLRN
jgi:hypothetical protein